VKTAGGKKKQRLDNQEDMKYDQDSLQSLQALLLCLEVSLRSDAHDGGSWIREGESQRFNLLLKPLGKLLQCRIQVEASSTTSYQTIVQGSNTDAGSVVDCIVALASAAGGEQLWKPLNHSVLQACSNESRAEVRKAGVMCLLSLIRSIGEEYMVLVPECLPVLSELLEDSDEEIAGLAQDCISLSEELLGESLQESLR
jgi:U3 small nucleolar RNA-associated protein 10